MEVLGLSDLEDYIFVEFNNELLKRNIYQTTE